MAQKLILAEGIVNDDLLAHQPFAGYIANGYEVTSIDGFSSQNNKQMAYVLLAERVADPVIVPTVETFDSSVDVAIYCPTEGAKIYYTTDGSTPTIESTAFTKDITLTEKTTIKAVAVLTNGTTSKVVSKTYSENS